MPDLILTPEQEQKILDVFGTNPDLIHITRTVFDNPELDGRSKEGRLVRSFLASRGKSYATTKVEPTKELDLTDHHKNFLLQNVESMSVFEMGKVLFPDAGIVSVLNKECRAILAFLRRTCPEKLKNSESALGVEYRPPESLPEAILKINKATAYELNREKLSAQQRGCVTAFMRFIKSPRVIQIINSYSDSEDRRLFETEFIRFVWDKPDLTIEEQTLYTSLCQDIVINRRLLTHINKLNEMFEHASEKAVENEGDKQAEISMRLSEAMKTKSEEYDKVQKRIESAIKKLNGDRAQRLRDMGERSASFLNLVEAFQQEDERLRLLSIAEAKLEQIEGEVDRLESLDELKARILGVSKTEVV